MNRWLLNLIAALFVCLPATVAWAQDVEKLNEEGITAFQEGRYEEAAQKFKQAWDVHPDPSLRKNEAIAWFKAGKCQPALSAAASFISYGDAEPESIKEAESVIANCKVEFARAATNAGDYELAEKLLDEVEPLNMDTFAREQANLARLELAEARKQALADQRAAEAGEAIALEDSQTESTASGGNSTVGWVLAGTGGAIIVGTLVYHIVMATSVASEHEDVANAGVDRERYDDLSGQLNTARWLVPTLYGVGAATAGVGVYFLIDSTEALQAGVSPTKTKSTRVLFGIGGTF